MGKMQRLGNELPDDRPDGGPALTQLAELRELAATDPQRAQDQAWAWLEALGRKDDQETLAELFGQGRAESPRTRTHGMPVGPMRNMPGAGLVTAALGVDCPWVGKTFHAHGGGGYNRMKPYARLAVFVLAPFHRARRRGGELVGFPFYTAVRQGLVAPKVDVLSIEYDAPEHDNPSGLMPLTRIRDELVEILPHTYLGRATWMPLKGDASLVGYFALRRDVNTEI